MTPQRPALFPVLLAGALVLLTVHTLGRFIYTPLLPWLVEDGLLTLRQGADIASWNYLGYLFGDFSDRDQLAQSPDRIVEMMDKIGIRRAQVNVPGLDELAVFRPALEQHPTRFAASLRIDPHRGRPLLQQHVAHQRHRPRRGPRGQPEPRLVVQDPKRTL